VALARFVRALVLIRMICRRTQTQFLFFTQCAKHAAALRYKWALLIDADEFVMPSRSDMCLKSELAEFAST
jgi:hypothetical protein